MKAPLCAHLDPPCERESTHIVIAEGENRGLGRRGPANVILLCADHFADACIKVREAGETFVWTECENGWTCLN